jgi:hypothetical protein
MSMVNPTIMTMTNDGPSLPGERNADDPHRYVSEAVRVPAGDLGEIFVRRCGRQSDTISANIDRGERGRLLWS